MSIELKDVLDTLGYSDSPHFYAVGPDGKPAWTGANDGAGTVPTEHLRFLRTAGQAGVHGVYTFPTRPDVGLFGCVPRPAVLVAERRDENRIEAEREAASLQNRVWNLSFAPFLIVVLPHQVRLYSGFCLKGERQTWKESLVEPSPNTSGNNGPLLATVDRLENIVDALKEFNARNIDNGQIWRSKYATHLDPSQRVDHHLLRSLRELSVSLEEKKLPRRECHGLIGKYIYLRYLLDREILDNAWMSERGIDPDSVFGQHATRDGLLKVVTALEDQFNGKVFPLATYEKITDEHVALTASVMRAEETLPNGDVQPSLPFAAYNFKHIPVETLSAIYEDFLHSPTNLLLGQDVQSRSVGSSDTSLPYRNEIGAVYTPELVADYILSEVEREVPLRPGIKVLDPACGSGVFLVLAYQRMVEAEIAHKGCDLEPERLKAILSECILGVEREEDACFVTEFSLILMMLHYCHPPTLRALNDFKFPTLHNINIFRDDFFNTVKVREALESEQCSEQFTPLLPVKFWSEQRRVNVVVGNPPWVSLEEGKKTKLKDAPGRRWIKNANAAGERPVGDFRVAEAFSWLVEDVLDESPIRAIGLLLPATSLFNAKSKGYRTAFFKHNKILRITNFAHLREVLFGGRTDHPAAAVIYRPFRANESIPNSLIHYAPLSIDQRSQVGKALWSLTINEGDIQKVSYRDACSGVARTWKLALWGSHRDRDALERLEGKFTTSLNDLCKQKQWFLEEGPTLQRDDPKHPQKTVFSERLRGQMIFDASAMSKSGFRFSVPSSTLKKIPDEYCYLRKRAGGLELNTMLGPHLIIAEGGMRYTAYSEDAFVMSPSQFCIAAPEKDKNYLRSVALYLSSSLAAYQIFFLAQQWGVWRQAQLVLVQELKEVPIPNFTEKQIEALAQVHAQILSKEQDGLKPSIAQQNDFSFGDGQPSPASTIHLTPATRGTRGDRHKKIASQLHRELQKEIDKSIYELLKIPEGIRDIITEWREVRLPLDREARKSTAAAVNRPSEEHLRVYARELKRQLQAFVGENRTKYQVQITYSHRVDLIQCLIEETNSEKNDPEVVDVSDQFTIDSFLDDLQSNLRERVSQWVYIQRGLRVFDGPRIFLYKKPRRIDWTRTQAMNDAADTIGSVLSQFTNRHASIHAAK